MKKILSILLCLCLLTGLLATSALASFSSPAGVFTEYSSGTPTGYTDITIEYDGDRFLGAYYKVSYPSQQSCTVYYYNADVSAPVLTDAPEGTTLIPVQNFPNLFAVTLPAGQRGTVDVCFNTDWGSGEVIRFSDGPELPKVPSVFTDYNNGKLQNGITVVEEFEGDKFIAAYYPVPYTSLQATTVYYYNENVNSLNLGKGPDGTTVAPVQDFPHLFAISLPANQHGTVNVGLVNERGGGEVIRFADGTSGHVPTVLPAVAPTCTDAGLTEGSICEICSKVLSPQEFVPANGHSFSEGKCTVCGAADPDYVAPTPPPVEIPFTDVTETDWFAKPVQWAVEAKVTGGKTATTFAPNEFCTRAQVVTFLYAAAGKPEIKTTVNPFVDVAADAWYLKPVLWAVENGITSGIDATHFGPDVTCTRAQVVTFLYAAAGKPALDTKSAFADVADTDWFAKPVIWAAQNEVTGGIGDNRFGPNDTCTRGQVVTFLYKVYG